MSNTQNTILKKDIQREKNRNENQKAFFLSIFVAFFLSILKGIFAVLTGSAGLLASAFDSFFDTLVSSLNAIISHFAQKPADKNHSFGHGKFEAFAALIQSLLIAISGIFLLSESFKRFKNPQEIESEWVGIAVMLLSFAATFFLVQYQTKIAQNTHSVVLKADSDHFMSDLFSNGAVIFGILASFILGVLWVDVLVCAVVAIILLKTAFALFSESFFILTDHELSEEIRSEIVNILEKEKNSKKFLGWHDLRSRKAGSDFHIDFHLEFSDAILLRDAHDISVEVEHQILEKFPNALLLIHFDTENSV